MRWRIEPTVIISALLGAIVLCTERGLATDGVILPLGWAIFLWVIAGLLFLIAVLIAIKPLILYYLKVKQAKKVFATRVIYSSVALEKDKLRQYTDALINDINQFVEESELSHSIILTRHDEATLHGQWQSNMQYNQHIENLFVNKFSQRGMNIVYFLGKRGIISEKEWEYFNLIAQHSHPNMEQILSLLKEYQLRLN